jgi:asparagine synthase (glutamine-hydrolysing)
VVIEDGQPRTESWWNLGSWLGAAPPEATREDLTLAVHEAVDGAVARQLVGDVPVGLFLSGGVDSSSIAASAALTSGCRGDPRQPYAASPGRMQ